MPKSYELIASNTVTGATAANISFSSIPSTYTDVVVKLCARGNESGANWSEVAISLNGSSSSFTGRALYGTTAVGSFATTTTMAWIPAANATSTTFGNTELYIPNYSGSANKSFSVDTVTENNSNQAILVLFSGLWSNTAAINQITLTPTAGQFVQNSTAYLYGIIKS
jgi:hypothetical protein